MNIAELGFKVDSDPVKVAGDRLDVLTGKTKRADDATDKFGTSADKAAKKTNTFGTSVSNMANPLSIATGGIVRMAAALGTLAGVVISAFSVQSMITFRDELAGVSTLVDTAVFDMERLKKTSIEFAGEFGGGAAGQVKAFNEIISAGTDDLAKASDILTEANKLAVGGATTVGVAANGLTNILGAYGDKVGDVSEISDAMFIAMRDGKTTIEELSTSLGKAAPLAAQTGVTFDELTAAVAALTLQGISTSESVTGIRAILTAVNKPTKQAAELAQELGIQFNSAGLKAKGFAGFMEEIMQKTGGSNDALAILFSDIQAMGAVFAFSGTAGDAFADTMANMATKAGATQAAFDKMAASPSFQLDRIWSGLEGEFLSLTDTIGSKLAPAFKFIADNMSTIVDIAQAAGLAMVIAFGPTLISMLSAATTAVIALTVAVAANPIGLIAVGLSAAIAYMVIFQSESEIVRDGLALLGAAGEAALSLIGQAAEMAITVFQKLTNWLDGIWPTLGEDASWAFGLVAEAAKTSTNNVIGIFKSGIEIIAELWNTLPGIVANVGISVANSVISAFESMVNTGVAGINTLVKAANSVSGIFGGNILDEFDAKRFNRLGVRPKDERDDPQATVGGLGTKIADIVGGNLTTDFVGDITKANDAIKGTYDSLDGMKGKTLEVAAAAADLGDEFEGGAGGSGDGKKKKGLKGKIIDTAKAAKTALEEIGETIADVAGGAVKSLIGAFDDGKVTIKEFADIALDSLGKIADKLIDMATSNLIGNLFGGGNDAWSGMRSVGKKGGGGLLGIIGSMFGFADGGAFSGGGSVVSRPTAFATKGGRMAVAGESGDEGILPLTKMSNGKLGVSAGGANDNSGNRVIVIQIDVTGANGNKEIMAMIEQGVGEGVSTALEQFSDKVLPVRVNEISERPRDRG